MAAGGSTGVISIWDLEKKKLHTVIRDAHDGPITSLHFFANEPVLLSGGADNSLKVPWKCFSSHILCVVGIRNDSWKKYFLLSAKVHILTAY